MLAFLLQRRTASFVALTAEPDADLLSFGFMACIPKPVKAQYVRELFLQVRRTPTNMSYLAYPLASTSPWITFA